jgi:hypothetical protein
MAYKTAQCTCPEDSKLVFQGHLPECPEVAEPELSQDADLLRSLAPPPPQEIITFICAVCGRPHLSRAPLMKCHNSGRWVLEGVHYYSQRYRLVE